MNPRSFSAPTPVSATTRNASAQSQARGSRRRFLHQAVGGVAAFALVPGRLVHAAGAASPNSRPTLAGVGVGGVGFGQLQECEEAGFQIVALCDVDDVYAKKAFDRWPKARRYRDYREMLATQPDVDAVYVGTPDHTHAVIVMEAIRRRKHVCCVKPLTRTLHECRTVVQAARAAGVATQVTAAPNTGENACRTCELIWAGVLGAVREVHVWSNRPVWPQGMNRPSGSDTVPTTLDWDAWLGPAPARPFKQEWPKDHPVRIQMKSMESWFEGYLGVYHPFNFRGWWDFGTGALGDMGCHHFNPIYRALKLKHPTAAHATASKVFAESAPLTSIVTLDYPAREGMPPLRLVWYDGGLQPPAPRDLGPVPLPAEGTLYCGDEGKLLVSWDGLRLLAKPDAPQFALEGIPKSLPRRGGTWKEWHEAVCGGEPAGCNFDWADYLTEGVLVGNLALRAGKPLVWDAAALRVTNVEEANRYVREPYRDGWSL
jgi:predicted dehydrogenase